MGLKLDIGVVSGVWHYTSRKWILSISFEIERIHLVYLGGQICPKNLPPKRKTQYYPLKCTKWILSISNERGSFSTQVMLFFTPIYYTSLRGSFKWLCFHFFKWLTCEVIKTRHLSWCEMSVINVCEK
jgi:hypothetical protein